MTLSSTSPTPMQPSLPPPEMDHLTKPPHNPLALPLLTTPQMITANVCFSSAIQITSASPTPGSLQADPSLDLLRLKIRADPSTRPQPRLMSSRLCDPTTASAYRRSITNAFTALADDDIVDWETSKLKVNQSAQDVLGRSRSLPKQPWISQLTLNIIDRRRDARLRGDMTEYLRLNAARNAAIATDRERCWGEEAERLESAA
ncbi:uncharacterized protein LOC109521465 [Hippocampus comes]|uniref:uncharacterized protein LOC109521465 n=1 Tax=Hippocampus comes TaxID=109280 RepID=UPI00094E4789|nr:PREDICTED: uncharacterized protein LOC109521465 [Hippocampus comes]